MRGKAFLFAMAVLTLAFAPGVMADYQAVFNDTTNPLTVLKPAEYTAKELDKISWKDGVIKVTQANAIFHVPGTFRNGVAELAATDCYRSNIELLARARKDFGAYYSLAVSTYSKTVVLKRFIWGKPEVKKSFPYEGGRTFKMALEFDGKAVHAVVNGARLGSLPDDGSLKEGLVGFRCGYWSNFKLASLGWKDAAPAAEGKAATEYQAVFNNTINPLTVLKPAEYTVKDLDKISWKDGVIKVGQANAIFHVPGTLRYGVAELAATDCYRSNIELIARARKDFGAYYSLAVSTHNKTVVLKRYIYGQPDIKKSFPYEGERTFKLAMEFDGESVHAIVNGKRLGSLPDDGSLKEGLVGIRCGYWANFKLASLGWKSAPPKMQPKEHQYVLYNAVPQVDLPKLKSFDLAPGAFRTNGKRLEVSLNQFWDCQPVDGLEASCQEGADKWANFVVPGFWAKGARQNFVRNAQGQAVSQWRGVDCFNGPYTMWLKRTFKAPAEWGDRQVELRIEDLAGSTRVYVNGKEVAAKLDPKCNFLRVDISRQLKAGAENEVRLQVWSGKGVCAGVGCIDLFVIPKQNFGDVAIDTDVEKKRLTLAFSEHTAPADGTLQLQISELDAPQKVIYQATRPFGGEIAYDWIAPRLWHPDDPARYRMTLSLLDGKKQLLDQEEIIFGYRQFQVRNDGFLLNGQPIRLKAETGLTTKATWWGLDFLNDVPALRGFFQRLKLVNLNCAYIDGPPTERAMALADAMGIMLVAKGRMLSHYELDRETAKSMATLEEALKAMKRNPVYSRHPSQIGFLIDVWYGYNAGCTNPNFVGQPKDDPNLKQHLLAQRSQRLQDMAKLYRKYFPAFESFTGGSGPVGNIYATHVYHTWGAPATELRAFFSKWAEKRPMPIFVGETYLPYIGSFFDLENFHGGGKNYVTENAVRVLGPDGYIYRATLGMRPFHERWDGGWFWNVNEQKDGGRYGFQPDSFLHVHAKYLEEIYAGWRYHGLTGYGNFDISESCFTQQWLTPQPFPQVANLEHRSYKPEGFDNGNARRPSYDLRFADMDFRPTLLSAPFRHTMDNISADLFHGGDDPLLQDHTAYAGEKVERSVMLYNDTPQAQQFKLSAWLVNSQGRKIALEKEREVTLKPFTRNRQMLTFNAPNTGNRDDWTLQVTLTGPRKIRLSQELQVFARESAPQMLSKLYIYDPEGHVAAFLKKRVPYTRLKDLSRLPKDGVLVVGRNALSGLKDRPDWSNLGQLRVLFMEQGVVSSAELLSTRTRQAFINAPTHPIFEGLKDVDFTLWQGNYANAEDFGAGVGGANWAAWGKRNMVAAHVFRRPHHGNILSLLVCGFDLFQTPLMEMRRPGCSWIASQLEISERLGIDPVATRLFYNMLRYMDVPAATSRVLFFGEKEGQQLLDKLQVQYTPVKKLDAATLDGADVLIVSAPQWETLRLSRLALNDFVYYGGTVFYIHAGKEFTPNWMPFTSAIGEAKANLAQIRGEADGVWCNGFGPSELFWKTEWSVPEFKKLPPHFQTTTPAVLAQGKFGRGRWVMTTLHPELFKEDTPATGKTVRLFSSILTSLGATVGKPIFPFTVAQQVPTLDLSEQKWEFATDEKNVGMQEEWHKGKGSPRWLKGLIADGIEVRVGQTFETFLRYDYDGYVWYRLTFDTPKELLESKTLFFSAGAIDDFDEVFLNGVKIGATDDKTPRFWAVNRNYPIPNGLLRPQGNFLAVRVFDRQGSGGIVEGPVQISVKKLDPNPRVWTSPWPKAMNRDYNYKSDIVRMY